MTEDSELGIIGAYVTEEDESNGHEKKEVMNKIIKQVTIVWTGLLTTFAV